MRTRHCLSHPTQFFYNNTVFRHQWHLNTNLIRGLLGPELSSVSSEEEEDAVGSDRSAKSGGASEREFKVIFWTIHNVLWHISNEPLWFYCQIPLEPVLLLLGERGIVFLWQFIFELFRLCVLYTTKHRSWHVTPANLELKTEHNKEPKLVAIPNLSLFYFVVVIFHPNTHMLDCISESVCNFFVLFSPCLPHWFAWRVPRHASKCLHLQIRAAEFTSKRSDI